VFLWRAYLISERNRGESVECMLCAVRASEKRNPVKELSEEQLDARNEANSKANSRPLVIILFCC